LINSSLLYMCEGMGRGVGEYMYEESRVTNEREKV
jgi:hypothetical protein